jgi:proteasome lid subunit RPN8/RPN11
MLTAPPREDLKAAIAVACRAQFPREACGFIVSTRGGKDMTVVPCQNVSATPLEHFRIRPSDFQAVEDRGGNIELVWHSHPNAKAEATLADKTCVEQHGIPFLIYALPADLWDFYAPTGWKADLIGRPFVFGVLDCYTLVRDYYASIGIEIPDFYREDNFWEPLKEIVRDGKPVQLRTLLPGKVIGPPLNLYVDNYEKAGFVRVGKLAPNDVILMRLQHYAINHAGIYLGEGMMLHHPPKSISNKIPFRLGTSSFYVRTAEMYFRHKTLLGKYPEV